MITLELTTQLAALVPLVMGLIQVFKSVGLPTKFAPLVSLVLGVIATTSIGFVDIESILGGLLVGLVASGLWSGTKNVSEEIVARLNK